MNELKEVVEEKLEMLNASLKSENPEQQSASPQPAFPTGQGSAPQLTLPRKFHLKDFALRHNSQIGEEPKEMKQRLVGAFKKLDSLQSVCENLRFGLHRGFSNRPWFCAIYTLD